MMRMVVMGVVMHVIMAICMVAQRRSIRGSQQVEYDAHYQERQDAPPPRHQPFHLHLAQQSLRRSPNFDDGRGRGARSSGKPFHYFLFIKFISTSTGKGTEGI